MQCGTEIENILKPTNALKCERKGEYELNDVLRKITTDRWKAAIGGMLANRN